MAPERGKRHVHRFSIPGRWLVVGVLCLAWLSLPVAALAAGGKSATKIYNVADTRAMDAGPSKWIADVYNGNLWAYGLLVVAVMAGMGLAAGFVMDRLVSLLGINLGRLEHRE